MSAPQRELLGDDERPALLARDARAVLLAACAVLLGGLLSLPQEPSRTRSAPATPLPSAGAPGRLLLTGARVSTAGPVEDGALAADGALALELLLDGRPGALLLSARVELPGVAVVLGPVPRAFDDDGTARLALDVLPSCPAASAGLSRSVVVAVVRSAPGSRAREARVRLDPGALAPAVVRRCGAVDGLVPPTAALADAASGAGTAPAEPRGPRAGRLAVALPLTALRAGVQVVGVLPGPGLAVEPPVDLPLAVPVGQRRVLGVGLRAKGCGGAPDSPPFLLRLASGATVAPSVDPALGRRLAQLRPFRCTAP